MIQLIYCITAPAEDAASFVVVELWELASMKEWRSVICLVLLCLFVLRQKDSSFLPARRACYDSPAWSKKYKSRTTPTLLHFPPFCMAGWGVRLVRRGPTNTVTVLLLYYNYGNVVRWWFTVEKSVAYSYRNVVQYDLHISLCNTVRPICLVM